MRTYLDTDPITIDAIYAAEDGGLNPVRPADSAWNVRGGAAGSAMKRYLAALRSRSAYQGCWDLSPRERCRQSRK